MNLIDPPTLVKSMVKAGVDPGVAQDMVHELAAKLCLNGGWVGRCPMCSAVLHVRTVEPPKNWDNEIMLSPSCPSHGKIMYPQVKWSFEKML